jgi:glycosidase
VGTFHGGDLAGLTQQLKAGWFKDLGVNAMWITAPYEQIHGWVVGGNSNSSTTPTTATSRSTTPPWTQHGHRATSCAR